MDEARESTIKLTGLHASESGLEAASAWDAVVTA